jgi:beta-galactosidase
MAHRYPTVFISLLILICVIPAYADESVAYIGRDKQSDQLIDSHWRFLRRDEPAASGTDFDDSSWTKLNLPHTWNNLDGEDGGNNYYRGPAWYRRHLKFNEARSYFVRFDGAATFTDVYVNGQHVGQHRGNWGAFCFDITKEIHKGDNILAVRVDNSHFEDIPPLSADFTVFGGLYRDVHLLTLGDISISPTDDASPGVYLRQSNVSAESADLHIITKLRNAAAQPKSAGVTCIITDANGKAITSVSSTDVSISPGGTDVVQDIKLDHPHLWDGRSDPHLYHATVQVKVDGKTVDQIIQPLGIRYFHVDPDQGFFLDGQHYALHGVNRHQDRLDKGWAIGKKEHDEDMSLILEMGCTGIRLAHYEHANYFYDLCDKNGLVVWAEAGLVNHINRTPAFYASAKQQLRELIKQNFNHPSIVMWGLFNELDYGRQHDPRDWELIGQLNDLSHQLDRDRLTTCASNQSPEHPANWITDITALNRYDGWYYGPVSAWPKMLDHARDVAPGKSIGISEYGAGASINQHEDPPRQPANPSGKWHPEEYQARLHETVWRVLKDRPWIWGTFLWNQFDFAIDSRHEGDTDGRNDKGMVTYDRKTRKDAFYFYKANWTDTPVLHITSARFTERPTGPTIAKVYSNCDSVELFLNGKSLGQTPGDTCVFQWNITLTAGKNEVRAVGYKNGKKFDDQVTWLASPEAPYRYSATQKTRNL